MRRTYASPTYCLLLHVEISLIEENVCVSSHMYVCSVISLRFRADMESGIAQYYGDTRASVESGFLLKKFVKKKNPLKNLKKRRSRACAIYRPRFMD